jgi:hypothetical protein
VNGSVLGWELVEVLVPLELDGFELVLVVDCVVCVSGALLADDEPLELEELDEPELEEPEPEDPLGCEVVVVPVSGSVYC